MGQIYDECNFFFLRVGTYLHTIHAINLQSSSPGEEKDNKDEHTEVQTQVKK